MIFVELCAGSAAVSLRWLSSKAKPPLSYQGGKRGYADAILRAMGQAPGAGRGHEIVLCEPGPWGEAWEHWRTAEGRRDTCDRLEAWADEDPRTLWERLRRAAVPDEAGERVATWAVLQFWSFGNKVVEPAGKRWIEHGFDPARPYRAEAKERGAARGLDVSAWATESMRVPDLIAALQALPPLHGLTVHRGTAQSLSPIPGALVYLDPPYEDTTGYGTAFPRAEVLATAQRWREAGALVVVSEAEPLPLPGWHHHELGGSVGFGRTWSKQRREVLTMSRAPSGQLGLPMRKERT